MELRHPRLAPATPVLWRGPGELQVGVVPGRALVFSGIPAGVATLLEQLDGTRTLHSALAGLSGARPAPDVLERVLTVLASAGLLSDGPVPSDRPGVTTARVRLVGAGALGSRVAGQLLQAGVQTLHLHDNDPVDLVHHPVPSAAACQAEALRAELLRDLEEAAEPGPQVTVLNHWEKPDVPGSTDFTVVALDGPECDRAVSDGLVRTDEPHLFVRTLGSGATVGPLVVPGHSACLRCLDLTHCDADPHWPTVLTQLTRIRITVPTPIATWAATVAVTQTLAWLTGGAAETLGGTVDLTPDTFTTRLRRWPAHPRCGCSWARTAEWGHGS
ncbi:MAG: ThiF family adenylyltransferase [Propionibacteriaceae bacterium]